MGRRRKPIAEEHQGTDVFCHKAGPAGEPEAVGLDVLAAVVSASPDGIVVLDGEHRIVYANSAFSELFGHPRNRLLGQDVLTLVSERDRQTVRKQWADARDGSSEPLLCVGYRADGSELEIEVRATVLAHQGKQFLIGAVRDVTERQLLAMQAAALAQAAASVAASDSIDAVFESISECALAGTRALAVRVTLDDQNDLAAWVGADTAPDGLRQRWRPAASAAPTCSVFQLAQAARRAVVYADARRQVERGLGTAGLADALKSLPWQPAAVASLVYGGAVVGHLTAIYREGEVPYAAETTFLAALADHAATAAVMLEKRQRLAGDLHDSVSQSLYAIQLGAKMARERLDQMFPAEDE